MKKRNSALYDKEGNLKRKLKRLPDQDYYVLCEKVGVYEPHNGNFEILYRGDIIPKEYVAPGIKDRYGFSEADIERLLRQEKIVPKNIMDNNPAKLKETKELRKIEDQKRKETKEEIEAKKAKERLEKQKKMEEKIKVKKMEDEIAVLKNENKKMKVEKNKK